MICIREYKSENHKSGVNEYTTKKSKIYIYVVSKCENNDNNYQATILKY